MESVAMRAIVDHIKCRHVRRGAVVTQVANRTVGAGERPQLMTSASGFMRAL